MDMHIVVEPPEVAVATNNVYYFKDANVQFKRQIIHL